MNPKGKEWIKKNWYRIVLHFVPMIILFYVLISILDVWVISLDNNASISWNLFVTVACFGSLLTVILTLIYLDKWSDRFDLYKKEYREYIKEGDKHTKSDNSYQR